MTAPPPPSTPPTSRSAAKDGLWVLGAKVYFILTGLVQQVVLGRVLGLDGYGALSTALSASSIAHNTIVQASLQGVSRTVARAGQQPKRALRRVLSHHTAVALALGALFWAFSPVVARALGAPHVTTSLKTLSLVFVFYGLYAPFIGALNGTKRIRAQASFDILSATLRTLGMVFGAALGARLLGAGQGPFGAVLGFALAAALVLVLSAFYVGVGEAGGAEPKASDYARELGSLVGGQLVLNLLFQADALLLRRFAADAALSVGQDVTAADTFVGAYRAAQLFAFLPYQLLASVTIVLFPLVARAQAEADPTRVREYVQNGLRIALMVLSLLLSLFVSVPGELIGLVYGAEAASLGGPTLRILGPSLCFLALLGVLTTCLNSLGHAKKTFLLTLVALVAVLTSATLLARGTPLEPELLKRMALGTGLGLILAVGLTARQLYREVGALVRFKSLGNILLTTALACAVGLFVLPPSLTIFLRAPLITIVQVLGLFALRELRPAELKGLLRPPQKKS